MPYNFDEYVLDTGRRELRRGAELIDAEPQVFDMLLYLIENQDSVVSGAELDSSRLPRSRKPICARRYNSAFAETGCALPMPRSAAGRRW